MAGLVAARVGDVGPLFVLVALAAQFAVLGATPGSGVTVAFRAGLYRNGLELGDVLILADGANLWPSSGHRIVDGKADC